MSRYSFFPHSPFVDDGEHFTDIRLIVYDFVADFDPGMGPKGKPLYTNNHACGETMLFEKTGCGSRTLETKDAEGIPNACEVYDGRYLLNGVVGVSGNRLSCSRNGVMQRIESPPLQSKMKENELEVSVKEEKGHVDTPLGGG